MSSIGQRLESWELLLEEQLSAPEWSLQCYVQVPSTMDAARDLCAVLPNGAAGLVLAADQTAGRGRQGRAWLAPEEGFFGTFVFRLSAPPSNVAAFTLAAGVVVAQALEPLGVKCQLKWPNDLVSAEGKKFSGILTELVSTDAGNFILTGIGINLKGATASSPRSASIYDITGRSLSAPGLAVKLAVPLKEAFHRFETHGLAAFRSAWLARAFGLGLEMMVDTGSGIQSGTLYGISEQGLLQLRSREQITEIISGHVISVGNIYAASN